MSKALLGQWKDRVLEAETEIGVVKEEINVAVNKRQALKQAKQKHDNIIEEEKKELLRRLETVEAEARELSALCKRTLREKDEVETLYTKTLDEYEGMHFLVHDIKKQEEQYNSRECLETKLQRESLDWAEEEHALRTKLDHLQLQIKHQRKQQRAEQAELEEQLAALEKQQQQERAKRCGEVKQQPWSGVQGIWPATSAFKATVIPLPEKSTGIVSDSRSSPMNKENRRGVNDVSAGTQLKSCLKASAVAATKPDMISSVFMERYSDSNYHPSFAASAPVSRAHSQSCLPQLEDNGEAISSINTAALHPPLRQVLGNARAHSYCTDKKYFRKRDFLGELTNRPE